MRRGRVAALYLNHIVNGVLNIDPEGGSFDNVELARQECILGARAIISARIKAGAPIGHDCFEITDEAGVVLETVPFRNALVDEDR